ncbi:MAG: DUF3459 domain-containing protein, partial [Anaerolineales bacterium]|nr:DUF3459 domain-containing protein [Anaerolineales bacterium]
MLLTLRGTPTLYYGDEIGLENGIISPEQMQDPQGINLGIERTRDVARTPMQWDDSPHAGFSTDEPWLPISPDYQTRNVAGQTAVSDSTLNLYRRLLWLRRQSEALSVGSYRPLSVHPNCFVYVRQSGTEQRLIALNFSNKAQTVSIPGQQVTRVILSTHLDREEQVDVTSLHLRPFEGVVLA